jgi:hypothetical protein
LIGAGATRLVLKVCAGTTIAVIAQSANKERTFLPQFAPKMFAIRFMVKPSF